MNTYLGASSLFCESDVDAEVIRSGRILYLEGYLFDPPAAQQAFRYAAAVAHEAGRQVALTLSDGFCVDRHRDAFRALFDSHVDLVFANESELCSLYETSDFDAALEQIRDDVPLDFDAALEQIRDDVPLAVIPRSEKGSVIVNGVDTVTVAAAPVERVVDTTGAGDLYAAGFLYGLARGYDLERCGTVASIAAAEVISHVGPRPQVPLAGLVAGR